MKFYFKNKKLEQLYTTGKSKKYRLDDNIILDFVWVVTIIQAAKDIYDFWDEPSLNFEKLEGKGSRYSFRLTRKYRLEVSIDWENQEHTIGIVAIEEISKHYQ